MGNQITPKMIKMLRERTGVGMGKCKEALVLAEGSMDKAIDHLRKTGLAAGVKKEGRETKEGLIISLEDQNALVIGEANAETDFVAQNDRFKGFLYDVVKQALESPFISLEKFVLSPYYKDASISVDQYRNLVIQTLGENIQIRRIEKIQKHPNVSYGVYSHMGGKLVVIVEIEGDSHQENLAKEIAMHVAAENPDFLKPEEIPAHVIEHEESIARDQQAVLNKPPAIIEKIVAGKVKAFIDQSCLTHQKYVKDNSLTVQQFVDEMAKKNKKPLSIRSFWRWKVGQ